MDFDRLLQLFRALNHHEVEYVLVGGVAINLHGLVRGTDDVDLFIRPDVENVARVRAALRSVWNDPEIDGIHTDDLTGEYATVRYGPPEDDLIVDLIPRLGTAFRYEDLEVEIQTVEGVPVRVATPRTLYRMKRDTLRPDDRRDAERLLERFGSGVE
jgi:hypothetical protein